MAFEERKGGEGKKRSVKTERTTDKKKGDRSASYKEDKPKRGFGAKSDKDEKPKRGFGEKSNNDDKPRRSYGEKSFDDKPRRSYGTKRDDDSPYNDRKRSDRKRSSDDYDSDKPRRSYGSKPQNDDKPRRSYGEKSYNDDKPRRSYGAKRDGDLQYNDRNRSDRKRSSDDYDSDKPRRSYGSKPQNDDKPRRSYGEKSYNEEKPRRSYGAKRDGDSQYNDRNRSDRKRSSDDYGSEKPRRSYGSKSQNDDKPRRSYAEKSFDDKPRRSYGEKSFDDKPRRSSSKRTSEDRKPKRNDEKEAIRLNRYVARSGICSRREADELIAAGEVKVNGVIITELGTKVLPTDKVHVGDQLISFERPVYVLLNKPKGYITTTDDPQKRKTVMVLVERACKEHILPVGRLDRNTTGLLLFTNDGDMAKKLTHPSSNIRKVYHVHLDKPLTKADMLKISDGMELDDGFIKPDVITYVGTGDDKKEIGMELHSGKNRIVRRIFEELGYEVVKLDRVIFANLTKKDLKRGHYRFLTDQEISWLKML